MSGVGTSCSGGGRAGEGGIRALPENFPVGMRVLLVDDDVTCLAVVKRMLSNCKYEVTTCSQATKALSLLRENSSAYDIIISDVHMPDMDGFRLLELVGLEMDLPVIMMSADTRFNIVMKGIKHGACDFLIKPVRIAELQNIWQHVVRRKWLDNKETEHSSSIEESNHVKQHNDDAEYDGATNDGTDGSLKSLKKKRDIKEDEESELDNADPSSKKPRVVWSVELHQQFVNAVNQLGIDKAVPKRILELMNVPGLTRENVASHLQKFRLYLKRLSGVAQQHTILPNSLCGASSNAQVGHLGSINFQTLAATGQIPAQTLAALQDELLGCPSRSLPLPVIDQSVIRQASLQENKPLMFDKGISFAQPVLKGQSMSSFSVWSSNTFGALASASSAGGMNTSQDSNMLPAMLQQQQQAQPVLSDTHHLINVQVSCLAPLKPSESFQFQSGTVIANQDFPVVPLQKASNMKVGSTLVPGNQNFVVLASQPSATLQRGNNPVLTNQSSEVAPAQPLPSISLSNDLMILNQNSGIAPSQPFTSFKTVRNPLMISQNPILSSSLSSSAFQPENNLVSISANPNLSVGSMDYNQLASQLNVGTSTVRQSLGQSFNNVVVTNGYSTIGSETSKMILPNDRGHSQQAQSSNENNSHHNGFFCHTTDICNVQTTSSTVLGKLPVQDQGSSLGFVGKSTFLPSRFAMDDLESPNSGFSHSNICIVDDGYLQNQDDFALNASVKAGPYATTKFK